MPYNKATFSENLNYYLKLHGENQSDLCELCGVSSSTASGWCNGTIMPRMDKVQKIADHFGCRLSDLVESHSLPKESERQKRLEEIAPGCAVVSVDQVTEGAACTVLLAEKYIDNDDSLMIANSDQYVDIDINEYLVSMGEKDGLIMTMYADDPKWSFIQFDKDGLVTLVREKEVISNEATVGIYNFRKGSDFVKYAYQMIDKGIRSNGEFYVAPVYNEMICDGKRVGFYNIGSEDNGMYGLGIPGDLEKFLLKWRFDNYIGG